MNTNAKINFYLENKNPTKPAVVFVYVMINNIRIKKVIPKIRIDGKYWDEKKQRLKATHPEPKVRAKINDELDKINKALEGKFENYLIQIKDKELLKSLVASCFYDEMANIPSEQQTTFFEYYQKYIDISKNELSEGFIKQQKGTMGKLKLFEQHLGRRLQFNSFSLDMLDEIFAFLISSGKIEEGKKKGINNNSTANGHIKRIKIFLSAGLTKKWHNFTDFKDYKRKRQATEDEAAIISLTWDEFLKLYSFDFNSEHLRKVRDIFCFSCVLGLRHGDYSSLTKKEFKTISVIDSNGNSKQMIETFIIKNRKRVPVRLPFSDYAKEIVERYANNNSPMLLPNISEQKLNKSIKEICRTVGLTEDVTTVYYRGGKEIKEISPKWELTSTHTGRKTFITKCVESGVPLHVVASFTGHSKNSKSLARYYNISDKMKVDFFPSDLYKKAV